MHPLHRKKLGIANGHRIVQRDVKVEANGAYVTSMYWYDEIDKEGNFVRSHVLSETNPIQKDKDKQPVLANKPDASQAGGKEHPDDLSVDSLRAHIRDHT